MAAIVLNSVLVLCAKRGSCHNWKRPGDDCFTHHLFIRFQSQTRTCRAQWDWLGCRVPQDGTVATPSEAPKDHTSPCLKLACRRIPLSSKDVQPLQNVSQNQSSKIEYEKLIKLVGLKEYLSLREAKLVEKCLIGPRFLPTWKNALQ